MWCYPWYKCVEVGSWRQVDGHDIADVTVECLKHCAWLHVPECCCRVSGSSQYLDISQSETSIVYFNQSEISIRMFQPIRDEYCMHQPIRDQYHLVIRAREQTTWSVASVGTNSLLTRLKIEFYKMFKSKLMRFKHLPVSLPPVWEGTRWVCCRVLHTPQLNQSEFSIIL